MRLGRSVRRGFTMAELIASMLVISILAAVSGTVIARAGSSYGRASARGELYTEGAQALELMASELRATARGTSGPQVWSFSPTFVGYSKSATGSPQPYFSYDSSAGTVTWGQLAGGSGGADIALRTVATRVTSCVFAAYDEGNAALSGTLDATNRAKVRRVEVTLTLARSGETVTLRTRVFLRSMVASIAQ